jgi:RND superfamily putative drug exporter
LSKGLEKLGAFVVRRAPWVVGVWVVIAIGLVLVANSVGRPTNDNLTLPGTGSTQATDLLDKYLPQQANGSVPIVIETKSGNLTSGSNKQAVEDTVKSLSQNKYVSRVLSPYSDAGSGQISKDGKIAYISAALTISSGELDDSEANDIAKSADPARKAGLEVSEGGYLGQELSSPSTELSEIIGVVAALIVLLFAFRTLVATPLPVTTAIVALAAGLALLGLLGHAVDIPTIAPTLAIMLGLAVGVDYSLFIITRHLRLLREGVPPEEAIRRSMGTSGSAVVFAGSTVVLALLCLYFSGIPLVRELGYATALVVAVTVLAATTLLPAVLGLIGTRILKLPFHLFERKPKPGGGQRGFARLAGWISRHKVVAMIAGIVLLAVLALPSLDLKLGAPDFGQLPKDTTDRQAYDALTEGFGVGTNGPLLIAVKLDPPAKSDPSQVAQIQQQQAQVQQEEAVSGPTPQLQAQQQQLAEQEQIASTPAGDPRLVNLEQQISKQKNVQSVSPAQTDKSGNAAVFAVTPKTSPSAYATQDLVNHLRDQTIPKTTKGTGLTAYVGGTTAAYIDLADKISQKLKLVILIVVALSYVLLMLVFRSIVIPLTSALLNLLALVAAYGILTGVFEKGWGISLIGLEHEMPVVSYVPLMMFAILFGLSMDYQMFMVTNILELHQGGESNRDAVRVGLARGGHVILAAASIMFLVFLSFVINGNPIVKQFGVGLAVAVAIDAWVVLFIVPAAMELIGERNWYLPRWLDRILPNLKVEGDVELKHDTAP